MPPVAAEQAGAVLTICFNRPNALNALDVDSAVRFRDIATSAAHESTVRAILVRGAGRAFMAGGDIASLAADRAHTAEAADAIITPFHEGVLALRRGPAPILAEIHGMAAGAGLSLALACDLVIAAEDATFLFAYTGIGASPDGSSTFFLPRLVGLRRALEIALLNEPITAARALELGLVTRTVPAEQVRAAAEALAVRIAAGPTRSFAASRRLMEDSFGRSLAEQLEAERTHFMATAQTADFWEGCQAFLTKREAQFHGR